MIPSPFTGELTADRFTVKKVLDLARAGRLRVPPFQRPLRWRRADHRLLLDSLYRRYPVGTLLLWRRAAPAATVVFGGFAVAAEEDSGAYWIVDGQQRIVSIVGCLLKPESPARSAAGEFGFLFDLEAEKFVDAAGQSAPHLVPVNQLYDPVQTAVWARSNGVSDDLHRKAQEVGGRLLGYEVPTYVTTATSDEELRTIFERANTAGRRMRAGEVFEALNKGLRPDETPTGLTERLQRVLHALDFGLVDDDDLQRALIGVAGHNPRERIPEGLRRPGAAASWEQRTAEALRLTVEFLRDAARIPHARMLPYSLPLITLPRFFHLFPNPRERSIELLVRWVWRGIGREAHMATNQNFNPIHNAFKHPGEEDIVQALLQLVGAARPERLPQSVVYNRRGMKTRLELAVLFGRGPRHIVTGQRLSPVEIFDDLRPEQAVIPDLSMSTPGSVRSREASGSQDLPSLPARERAALRSVAARLLHPRGDGQRELARRLSVAEEAVLTSHAITDASLKATRRLDWDAVVAARKTTIRADVESTIHRLARWEEDGDAPSIEAILGEPGDRPATHA